jgi:imidazolonepropionase-like amidohydrolase
MYLNQRPDLLDRMAAAGQVLVPTFSCFYGVAGLGRRIGVEGDSPARSTDEAPERWSDLLVDLAVYNLDQADRRLKAARAAGVAIAAGLDWHPLSDLATEILRMIHHGLSVREALVAATDTAARALGLAEHVGTIVPGKLADLVVIDGDPIEHPALLRDRDRIWLVMQLGEPIAGAALEQDLA